MLSVGLQKIFFCFLSNNLQELIGHAQEESERGGDCRADEERLSAELKRAIFSSSPSLAELFLSELRTQGLLDLLQHFRTFKFEPEFVNCLPRACFSRAIYFLKNSEERGRNTQKNVFIVKFNLKIFL